MKIIVTGANGLLGREVWRSFEKDHDLIAIGRTRGGHIGEKQWHECDLTQADTTYNVITRENPDLVIHSAAYNDVDRAEQFPEEAFLGNSVATRNIALACQRFDTAMMSVSTDYVFDGETQRPQGYRECDPCRPVSRYGESKYWAEQHVQQLLNKFFIIRTSWLFGPHRATWVDNVVKAFREGKEVTAVSDMRSIPTYTPDLAQAMLVLAESRHYGIYHLTNSGSCTRVELAQEVAKLHPTATAGRLRSMTQSELRLAARRPTLSVLENLSWRLEGHPTLRSWQDALAEHFERATILR